MLSLEKKRKYSRRDEPLPAELAQAPNPLADYSLHTLRCEADPIYRMLLFGSEPICMDDGTRVPYIDVLLRNARQILAKKYGIYYAQSAWITHMDQLFERYQTVGLAVKVFAFNYIMFCESTIATCMTQLYDIDEPAALFPGRRGPQQLFLYLRYFVTPFMEQYANKAYNKYTCVAEMEQHLQHAVREYILGPFQVPRLADAVKK